LKNLSYLPAMSHTPSLLHAEISRRRTFAIISHPDTGKTTLTEKLLWFGGAIEVAGEVRGLKALRHATSDWIELEKTARHFCYVISHAVSLP